MTDTNVTEDLRGTRGVTPNHGYPTFPESGPSETLRRIGMAFEDIDQRIDGVSGEIGSIGADDVHDATETGRALMRAESAEAARKAIGAGTSDFDGAYSSLSGIPSEFRPEHHTHEIADVDGLQSALDAKADVSSIPTASTLEGVGAAGRAVIAADDVKDAVNALGLTSVYRYRGSVASRGDLPEDAEAGDVYNVEEDGMNYAWNGADWDAMGSDVTLSSLGVTATADELNMTKGVTSDIQTQLDAKMDASAASGFQPAGDYATGEELRSGLALKQDAATAFDGAYGSLTGVPEEFKPEHHTHEIADVDGLQDALDAKADETALADMETKTDAASTYQPIGDYATKAELAAKQDASTAFDGQYGSLSGIPSEFAPSAHTHEIADVNGLQDSLDAKMDASASDGFQPKGDYLTAEDIEQYADYAFDADHTVSIRKTFASDAVSMKAGVYLVTEGNDLPDELSEWKATTGVDGTLTGYLHLFDYMPDGSRHDHLALLMAAIRSTDGSEYRSGAFVFDGPQNRWMLQTSGMDAVAGLDEALESKAGKEVATTGSDGLMSASDKTKLDGVEEGANKYVLPKATADEIGGVTSVGLDDSVYDGSDPATVEKVDDSVIDAIDDIESCKEYLKTLVGGLNAAVDGVNAVSSQWGAFAKGAVDGGLVEIRK